MSDPKRSKISKYEGYCPKCGINNHKMDRPFIISKLAIVRYRKCNLCDHEFVDTYLITYDGEGNPNTNDDYYIIPSKNR